MSLRCDTLRHGALQYGAARCRIMEIALCCIAVRCSAVRQVFLVLRCITEWWKLGLNSIRLGTGCCCTGHYAKLYNVSVYQITYFRTSQNTCCVQFLNWGNSAKLAAQFRNRACAVCKFLTLTLTLANRTMHSENCAD